MLVNIDFLIYDQEHVDICLQSEQPAALQFVTEDF
jgi:hypothetical protein